MEGADPGSSWETAESRKMDVVDPDPSPSVDSKKMEVPDPDAPPTKAVFLWPGRGYVLSIS